LRRSLQQELQCGPEEMRAIPTFSSETMRIFFIVSAAITAFLSGATALDNGLALTPPMGWRSWNAYGPHINQDLMDNAAEMMVDTSRGFSLKGGACISTAFP